MNKTIIVTFDGDIHFIVGRSPAEVATSAGKGSFLPLPNGSLIASSSIKGFYTHEDYVELQAAAAHHKRRDYLGTDGYWHGPDGAMLEKADLPRLINKVTNHHELQQTNKPAIHQ